MPDAFWASPAADLLSALASTPDGLTDAEAARRAAAGPGPKERHGASAGALLLNQVRSPLVLLLLAAMALSLFLGETADAMIVLAVVVGSAVLGFSQEYRASRAIERLLATVQTTVTVRRGGRDVEIAPAALVPGDVVLLAAGTAIPADARLIQVVDLYVDESALTGESYPSEKALGTLPADAPLARRTNAVFEGTHVVSGTGRAVVVKTGDDTEYGRIAESLARRPPETEFEAGLRRFGGMLVRVTVLLVAAIFVINVVLHRPFAEALLFALAIGVGLTPELLPAIVSVTLARGAQRMASSQVIVRRLGSIENFGSIDVLCSDKTGTLTEGRVRVHAALDAAGEPSERVRLLAVLNATFESGFPNPIDDALRRETVPGVDGYAKVDEVPYDFIRKRLSVVVEQATDTGPAHRHTMITKGALRNVLAVCDHAEAPDPVDGQRRHVPLAEVTPRLDERFAAWSAEGLRVLGVAAKDVTGDPIINKDDEQGMVFVGFLLLEDPPKPGAREAIAELRQLGVGLKVITGDNHLAASRIGAQMGVDRPDVLTGGELHALDDAALQARVGAVDIFAETEPNQKERILAALRRAGHVVGYLGDGINDATALHVADVGISVDTAVDVARESADIVLLRQDLGVLAQGVREGRATIANTLKYVSITTSANFGNMVSMAAASLLLPFFPLLPKQILLNNFLSDIPSMAIATDRVDPDLVDRPIRWDIGAIRRFMTVFGLVSSAFDLLTFSALLWLVHSTERQFQTGWFIESLMTELFIVLVVRTRRSFFRSRPSGILLGLTLAMAVVTVFLPWSPIGPLFGLVPLPPSVIGLLVAITGGYLVATEVAKRLLYRGLPGASRPVPSMPASS